MLDADQTPIKSCAFPDGRTHSYDEPLHPVVSESRVFSVCEDGDWTKFAAAGSPQVTIPDLSHRSHEFKHFGGAIGAFSAVDTP